MRRRFISRRGRALALVLVAGLLLPPCAAADIVPDYRITRVSLGTGGIQANGPSYYPVVSGNGRYVVFRSEAQSLCESETGKCIIVFDRFTRRSEQVGTDYPWPSPWSTTRPSISHDGRFVAFNTETGIYVWDRQSGQVSLVDVGVSSGANPGSPGISDDGRFVVFESWAANLVPHDTNDRTDVFVYDRTTGEIERVSVSTTGIQGNDRSIMPQISADGRIVSFMSLATSLVPGSTSGSFYVHDCETGETRWMPDSFTRPYALSADGRYLAYMALYWNGDQSIKLKLYRYDVEQTTREDSLIAISDSTEAQVPTNLSLSADGRFVAFASPYSTVVGGDGNYATDIFVYDTSAQLARLITRAPDQAQANGSSSYPSISADGRVVVFLSSADNLVPGDTNSAVDVLVYEAIDYAHAVHIPLFR